MPQCSLRDSVADPPPSPTPRCLDDPCLHAPLSDPGAPPTPGHYSAGDGVFRTDDYVDSAAMLISGLNHAACTLHAQGHPGRATLGSRWGPALAGQDSHLRVAQKVSVMSIPLHACPRMPSSGGILLHQALPGARRGNSNERIGERTWALQRRKDAIDAEAATTPRGEEETGGRIRSPTPGRAASPHTGGTR